MRNNDKDDNQQTGPNRGFGLQDLFQGKQLDILAAALLLTGKLQVDSVEVFRGQPVVIVTLLGNFKSENKTDNYQELLDLLIANRNVPLDDVFAALQRKGKEMDDHAD